MKFLGVFLFVVAVAAVVVVAAEDRVRYDGCKVFELTPETEEQLRIIVGLQSKYDVWRISQELNSSSDVMVRPYQMKEFQRILTESGIRSRIRIQNVQDSVDRDYFSRSKSTGGMEWTKYHPLEDIYQWLDSLPKKYPHVKVLDIGRSYENRTIKGLEITFGKGLTGVMIDAGIHAREWLSPAGSSWMINKIIQSKENSIFRKYNYYYIPVLNPDGYVYSWKSDRYWRKTRKPYKTTSGKTTYGADPNRNFDSHWEGSNDTESECYPGPKPFSEIEIKTFSDFVKRSHKEKKLDIFISYHTYGSLLMYPWGWTKDPAPLNKKWEKVGLRAGAAWSAVHGEKVHVGQSSHILYFAKGTTKDWYYEAFNGTFVFIYEMRGKDFVIGQENIIPSGEEHLASLESLLKDYPGEK